MPLYEYKCRDCDSRFEVRRSMADESPVLCPDGHPGAVKLLSAFASIGASTGGSGAPAPMPSGGGGCGSACGCH